MAVEWPCHTVIDLQRDGALLVEDGNHGEYRPRPDEFVDTGVAFIRAADMGAGRVLFDKAAKINQRACDRITKGVGKPGDVLLSHKGTVGKVALVPLDAPGFVCSPQTTFWRTLDESRIDRRYLHVFLRSHLFQAQLATRAGETDMAPYVSLTSQRGLSVVLPPISEQRAIAHVIGTLDDKFELNRRMNETLEAIARTIFQSWFVDFDPVRAKASGEPPESICRRLGLAPELLALFPDRLVDSELGEVPEGWAVGALGDTAVNPRRGVQPDDIARGTPYIGLEHMPRRSIALSNWDSADAVESNKFAFIRGEILFGKLRPYFHKVGVAPLSGVCSTDIVVAAPKTDSWLGFVLGHTSSDAFVEHVNAGSTGTKMPRTSWSDMSRFSVVIPSIALAQAHTEVVASLLSRIVSGVHESRLLAATRDALLPKLISGELRIPQEAVAYP